MEFNSELARQAVDLIRMNPDAHMQGVWRCGTGQCFAGWTAVAAGAQWANENPMNIYGDFITVTDELLERFPELDECGDVFQPDELGGERVIHVSDFARVALGITQWQSSLLFAGQNTREGIEAALKGIENDEDYNTIATARNAANGDEEEEGEFND